MNISSLSFINEWKKLKLSKSNDANEQIILSQSFDITKLFNQFYHLKFEHCKNDNGFNEIYKYFKKKVYDNNDCNINECLYVFNHHRDRFDAHF